MTSIPLRLAALLPCLLLADCRSVDTFSEPVVDAVPAFPALPLFDRPTFITTAPGDDRLYVVTQAGIIYIVDNDPAVSTSKVFLDLSAKVLPTVEQGMFGLAFDPDYQSNGTFYVAYNPRPRGASSPRRTDIARFGRSEDPDVANPISEFIIYSVDQTAFGDNKGGWLGFGPDGKLYVSLGDGGGVGDPGNGAIYIGSGLGKILRLDKDGRVPPDNPFAQFSSPDARGRVWAFGFRNPYRASFDRVTGELWAGDIGQTVQEVNYVVRGGNYGWRKFEGANVVRPEDPDPGLVVLPTFSYPTGEEGRCAIIGGYVYRGAALGPRFYGRYVFADRCTGEIFFLRGSTAQVIGDIQVPPTSFGEDAAGELYITAANGRIFKLVPPE